MSLCIIPARGGSKRIPRKNIKLFNGKPMIAYSILAAQESDCFKQIIVSTDDDEIAQVAREYGADVPFMRPAELSDDFATTGEVVAHSVEFMQRKGWKDNDVCCIYATAPFVQSNDLRYGLKVLREKQVDFAFSVCHFAFPIQRALKINIRDEVTMFQPELWAIRSQDLEEAWHDAGQFYWGTKQAWLEKKPIFNSQSAAIRLPRYRVQDIDTIEDWTYAEMMMKVLTEFQAA